MTNAVATFFADRPRALELFEPVRAAVMSAGPSTMRITKSQISFGRKTRFAWVWTPDRWLSGKPAPLVLSIGLRRRDPSPRWKEVVEPRPGRFMHHLEIWSEADVDDEVAGWLQEAWSHAGAARSP
jgi:Domain of unknown function (DUF5655)